jgi:hypothetical protein
VCRLEIGGLILSFGIVIPKSVTWSCVHSKGSFDITTTIGTSSLNSCWLVDELLIWS